MAVGLAIIAAVASLARLPIAAVAVVRITADISLSVCIFESVLVFDTS
jgi:hypothetical protein